MEKQLLRLRAFTEKLVSASEEEWQLHVSKLHFLRLKRKEMLLNEGEVCDFVGFVCNGMLRSFELADGKDRTIDFFLADSYATNYVSFLGQSSSETSIEAMEDCELLMLYHQGMHECYRQSHTWERYGRLIAEWIFIDSVTRTKLLIQHSPEENYKRLLRNNPEIAQKAPLRHIASYLGIAPESLSRIRKRMMKD